MAGWTVKLGNVFLPYSSFEWPKYRGTFARVVEIDVPSGMYAKLVALAKSIQGGSTTLTITAPISAGANPGDNILVIGGIYIDRIVKMSEEITRVFIADRRFILGRYVTEGDYNIRFGDGYLEKTGQDTYKKLLKAMIDAQPGVAAWFHSFVNFPVVKTPDGLHQSGLAYQNGFGEIIERSGGSLTVWNDGYMRLVDRGDVSQVNRMPSLTAYSWSTEPGWTSAATYISGRPRKIYVYSQERHCLRMQGVGSTGTVSRYGPQTLQVQLTQVYKGKDSSGRPAYVSLSDLLTSNGFSASDLTDEAIAKCYMSNTFEGTGIYSQLENDATKTVINAVHECWRQLWKVEFTGLNGAIGGWTDWAFGKINADGSVLPVTVECPWVEFLDAPAPTGQGGSFIGTATTINHASPAPFEARWEGDPSLGIIRLHQKPIVSGNDAVPGALLSPLTIKRSSNIKDGKGNGYLVDGFDAIESEPRERALFDKDFNIYVYACATRRMPNDETKWHKESVDGFADGDISFIELPVGSDLLCIRNYVGSTDSGDIPQTDGLGPIRNLPALTEDAEVRAQVWKTSHCSGLDGFGVAEGVQAFKDVEVKGPISEVVLEVGQDTVRTRVVAGNLADDTARERIAAKRLADRKFTTNRGF